MAMKRSGKFYRKNEEEVMRSLGLEPTVNSGSGWIEKEDGQNEHVICQLKSTDANSISVKKLDLDKLSRNAAVSHKLPVFAIQFLESQEVYLIVKPEILQEVSEYIETGKVETLEEFIGLDGTMASEVAREPTRVIRSSDAARKRYRQEQNAKYKKKGKSAL